MCHKLDHEKLDVYQLELQFVAWATDLIVELCDSPDAKSRRITEAIDHLDRAALSSLFNTAEGNGKRQMPTRAKFFDDARGSATECAACLDALVSKRACSEQRVEQGKSLLVRVVSMLTKLVDRFSTSTQVCEESARYRIEGEDEGETRGRSEAEEDSGSLHSSSSSIRLVLELGKTRKSARNRVEDENEDDIEDDVEIRELGQWSR